MHDVTATVQRTTERIADGYDRPDRPLGGYAAIMAGYAALMAGSATLLARRHRLPDGLRLGDVSCPFCLDQWVASAFVVGLATMPRFTRFLAATFAVRAGADFLHFAYAAAEHAAE